jgi:hypothetical protein
MLLARILEYYIIAGVLLAEGILFLQKQYLLSKSLL